MDCDIYMGTEDIRRQRLNVIRMKLLGARVMPVESGSCTLKDAMNEAIRDWVTNVRHTHYVLGSVAGPHPYPMLVRDFQAVIGQETRAQMRQQEGRLPDCLVACVGGGSNAMGLFYPFLKDPVRFIGVEAAGHGIDSGHHSATLVAGNVGVLHGACSYLLQDPWGNIQEAHSLAPGLDYPGVGPEHSYFKESGRAQYVAVKDQEALAGFKLLSQTEGILPALETAHAVAYVQKTAKEFKPGEIVVINLSGRGDKDVEAVAETIGGGMKKINAMFKQLAAKGEKALIPYVTAGDPDLETTRNLVLEMARQGADLIELGIPFSDPLADGPTIQAACQRALKQGVNLPKIIDLVRVPAPGDRDSAGPHGVLQSHSFLRAGAPGPGRSPGRGGRLHHPGPAGRRGRDWHRAACDAGVAPIFLAAPTSGPERIRKIGALTRGFLYYVSVTGITGARTGLPEDLKTALAQVRNLVKCPLAVGFGISTPAQVADLAPWWTGSWWAAPSSKRLPPVKVRG